MTKTVEQQTITSSVFAANKSFLFILSRRLMELQKSYELHGVLTSLHDAIELLRDSEAAMPEWVLNGALRVIRDRLVNPLPIQKGGPGANELAKVKNDLRHFRRWVLVCKFLNSGATKRSKKMVFKEVSDRLKSHGERSVSPEAVEKSYYKVEKEKTDPTEMWKYRPAMHLAAKLTGTLPGSDNSKQ